MEMTEATQCGDISDDRESLEDSNKPCELADSVPTSLTKNGLTASDVE